MNLKKILKLGVAFGFLGAVGLGMGCSSNSRGELGKNIVFEQKSNIDYKGNLNKVVDGVKIDASFSSRHYCFYGEGRANGIRYSDKDCQARVGVWSDAEFPKETNSRVIDGWLNGPYLQMVGIKVSKNSEKLLNSETRLTDYFHDDGKPEAFAVPVISKDKFGAHVFFDEDYIKKIKNPQIAMVYFIASEKKAGEFFSHFGKINLKKTNGVYCGHFEISNMPKYQTIFLVGNFKKKENYIPISSTSERTELITNLICSKNLAEIIGNDDCIMIGFSEKLYD